MKNKCTVIGDDNMVIQNNEQSSEPEAEKHAPLWDSPAVTILCVFNFLLGCAAYRLLLWRWLP